VLALRETSCKPLLGSGPCVATHAEAMSLVRGAQRARAGKKPLAIVRERA
jgi:MHS family proline/betaine transporter-like MFS transporter